MTEEERHDIELLLPWFATGRLAPEERFRVEAAIAEDPSLRRQLKLVEEEMQASVAVNEALQFPDNRSADRLMAMVAHEPKSTAALASGWFHRLQEAFRGPARVPLRWAAVSAALLVAVQAATLGVLYSERLSGGYSTASGPAGAQAPGTYVLARFNDGVTASAIADALLARSVAIVDGPKAGGLYTLRIGDQDMPAVQRDARIAELKAVPGLVTFMVPLK